MPLLAGPGRFSCTDITANVAAGIDAVSHALSENRATSGSKY